MLKEFYPQKILIIQTAFLGDVIVSSSIFREIKKIYPNTLIDVIITPEYRLLLENNPHINEVILFNKKTDKTKNTINLIHKVRKRQYDAVISIQGSIRSSLIMLLSGIKIRIGFKGQMFLTHTVDCALKSSLHRSKRVLGLLSFFTGNELDYNTEINIPINIQTKIKKTMGKTVSNKSFKNIGIAPGSIWYTKRWPKENFVRLTELLKDENINIFLLGAKKEEPLCLNIIEKSKNQNLFNFAGKLNIIESAALISNLDLMISNDSAPLHIANSVNTPVFAFFGPTVKEYGFYPYRENDKIFETDIDCRPCSLHGNTKCPLKHHNCMKDIQPDVVKQQIVEFLSC